MTECGSEHGGDGEQRRRGCAILVNRVQAAAGYLNKSMTTASRGDGGSMLARPGTHE